MEWLDLWQLLYLKTLMLGHGGSSAGSYLADPTSPIPSHCAVIILFQKCPSASIVATSTLRVNYPRGAQTVVIKTSISISLTWYKSLMQTPQAWTNISIPALGILSVKSRMCPYPSWYQQAQHLPGTPCASYAAGPRYGSWNAATTKHIILRVHKH